jgi:serine protease AprX
MPISIPRSLVEYILLGPAGDRRQLQDSPILGDVWIAFAIDPDKPRELLITPHRAQTAGLVATRLDALIDIDRRAKDPADIAYLQGIIAARLYFHEVLRVIVPMTEWWKNSRNSKEMRTYLEPDKGLQRIREVLEIVQNMVAHWSAPTKNERVDQFLSAFDRYAALAGLILWASGVETPRRKKKGIASPDEALADAIKNGISAITEGLTETFGKILLRFPPDSETEKEPLVFQVSLNREASMAVLRSVPAVKADAARTLFSVKCGDIAWAVVDSGIKGDHHAFKTADGGSRVKASFDFSNFRKIVSLDSLRILGDQSSDEGLKAARLAELLHDDLKQKPTEKEALEHLIVLANDAKYSRPIHWESVRPFVEIKITTRPKFSDHGTHVAGIIGADRNGAKTLPDEDQGDYADGMCPDIQLYDFRVLAPTIKETEFAIIAALQYIRYLNQRNDYVMIHGANLSLSIPHDVRNYACGRTPVCVECERLVDSGVVVVTAAGNLGYQTFQTKEGSYEGYTAFSVTDPGNADGVITVGATHRYSPHTYGVSFFSSRGPTGDGRLKPDLVAPGERIRAPFREGWGDLDGTSMAAPHVSGAAAMLMARYSELIGQPRRVKSILCQSATDLCRERSFQGQGMLDVLRAFQSI